MKLPKNDMVKTLYLKIMVIFLTLVSFESLMYLTKWKTWQPYQHQDKRTLVVKPIAAAVTASSSASTKAESDFMKRMEIRMENRKKFLQDACKRLGEMKTCEHILHNRVSLVVVVPLRMRWAKSHVVATSINRKQHEDQ